MAHGDITHIDIPVDDVDAAKGFYGSLFGWQIAAPPGFDDYPMWRAPNQISGGGLAQRSDDFTQPRSYVEVDSIDAALGAVEGLGGTVLTPKTPISDSSWFAVIGDPSGNRIGLFEGTV
jgi:predicted enzyme related to lactoylglutathione lyase